MAAAVMSKTFEKFVTFVPYGHHLGRITRKDSVMCECICSNVAMALRLMFKYKIAKSATYFVFLHDSYNREALIWVDGFE